MTSSDRPRILLVEDDDAVRRSMQLLLVANGYDVRAYRNGAGFPKEVADRAVLLIADLVLPEDDGIAVLADLRAAGWARPAMLVSGYLTPEASGRAREAGYDLMLPKPVEPSLLVRSVAKLVTPGES